METRTIVCFTNSCTYCRIKLFEAVFQCFSLLSSLFKRYGRALSLTWILWKSKKKKCQKIEDENFELLNRRNSKNKSHIIGILALWDAQKCMVYWDQTQNYRDNRGQSFTAAWAAGGVMSVLWNSNFKNTAIIKLYDHKSQLSLKYSGSKININFIAFWYAIIN